MHIDTGWYTDTIAANPEAAEFAISTAGELAGLADVSIRGGGYYIVKQHRPRQPEKQRRKHRLAG
ncbi:MAG: hypothetical protein FWC23_02205 [Chitinispirillia bacterium]|nr:hypothetical protein [Chitinispirillia bacterium]MCL2267992.1 hypothetical protein [Chitinispirillia bacterium]